MKCLKFNRKPHKNEKDQESNLFCIDIVLIINVC